jgi:iron complex outermembrane receptor protein
LPVAILIAACLVAADVAAQPQPADTAVVEIPGVQVRGTRPAATTGGAGSVTAKLDSLSLKAAPTVEQALRALPGTYIRTNSRGEAEVTVRGSESRQVAVLLDGVPLTFAWDGRADVSVIPALGIEEVSIVRGLSSLAHGPNTLGGVVELRSLQAGSKRAQLRGGVDHLGAYGTAASMTIPRGVFSVSAGGGYRNTPGFALPRGLEEPVPAEPNRRLNTDLNQVNGFLSMRLDSDSGPFVSLLGVGARSERGIAAQLGVTGARFWRYPFIARGIGVLSAGTGRHGLPWGGRGDLEVSAGYDRGRTEIDAFDSRDYSTLDSEEDGNDKVLTLRTTASQSIGDRAEVRANVTYGDIRHDEILDGVLNAYRQTLLSGAAQTLVRLPGAGVVQAIDVTAGATFDAADTPKTGNKPSFESLDRWGGRFGLAAHVGGGATTVHSSVSQRARFPSLRELYSGALGSFEPNPNLKPEHLLAFEGGVTTRMGLGSLQILGFHHRLSDAVVRIRPPGQNFQRVNQEGIRSVGVEVLASRAFGVVEVSADGIVQNVEVLDPAAGLARPENMPEVMGALRIQVPVAAGIVIVGDARFTGEQFVLDPEAGGESKLAEAGQLGIEIFRNWTLADGIAWFRGVQLRAAVDNVTDTVQYEAFGLPAPGRTARLEFRAF